MAISAQLERLAVLLCGEFINPTQASENPAWFVQLRLWQRRLPQALFQDGANCQDSITLFLEQANHLKLDQPYRQRLLRLFEEGGQLYGQYYQFNEAGRWRGAGAETARLQQIQPCDVSDLPGCRVAIRPEAAPEAGTGPEAVAEAGAEAYGAALIPGGKCQFEYDGKLRQVVVGFDVAVLGSGIRLRTYDKGIDPETGQGLWGALMGPYEFEKVAVV
jgi:hypothetical protein